MSICQPKKYLFYDGMNREQAKEHPVWRIVARDQKLLDDYVNAVAKEREQRVAREERPSAGDLLIMPVHVFNVKRPVVYPIRVTDLFYGKSDLACGSIQYNDRYNDRLVAVVERKEK